MKIRFSPPGPRTARITSEEAEHFLEILAPDDESSGLPGPGQTFKAEG
jgi:hypothetical protein